MSSRRATPSARIARTSSMSVESPKHSAGSKLESLNFSGLSIRQRLTILASFIAKAGAPKLFVPRIDEQADHSRRSCGDGTDTTGNHEFDLPFCRAHGAAKVNRDVGEQPRCVAISPRPAPVYFKDF